MRNIKSLKTKILGIALSTVMVLGSINIPVDRAYAADGDSIGVLTVTNDNYPVLNGEDVIDDSGAVCSMADLKKIRITRDATYNSCNAKITGSDVGNSGLDIEIEHYNSLEITEGASLICNYFKGDVKNNGTINTVTADYDGSGSGMTFTNNGILNATSSFSLARGANSFINNTGASFSTGILSVGTNSDFTNNGSLSASSISLVSGDTNSFINNSSDCYIETFDTSGYTPGQISNYGTIEADTMILTNAVYSDSSAEFIVNDSLTLSGFNSEYIGTVHAEPGAHISSDGGTFVLDVNGHTETISGSCDDDAIELAGLDPGVIIQEPSEHLLGQKLDDIEVSVDSGYDGEWYFMYMGDDDDEPVRGLPEGVGIGDFVISVIAPSTSNYKSGAGEVSLTISYMDLSDCIETGDGEYLSISGVSNGVYAKDSITLTPATGYQVKTFQPDSEFADSVTLSKEDLYPEDNGGNFYEGFGFYLKKKSDGAETDMHNYTEVVPSVKNVIFDDTDPVIDSIIADGEEVDVEDRVTAKDITVTVSDENLDTVTVAGTTKTKANGDFTYDSGVYTADFDLTAVPGNPKTVNISAADLSERSISMEFTLDYLKDETSASVRVDDVYAGNEVVPVLSTDSDGASKVKYEYKLKTAADSTYDTAAPLTAGEYTVRATVPETDLYYEIICEDDFNVLLNSATATVTVADTVIGTDYDPVLNTVSDGKSKAVFEYKKSDAPDTDYTGTKPAAAGTYTVRATVPETGTYEEVIAKGSFTISKKTASTAVVTVPDTTVGTDYAPVLTTDSDGKNKAVFEYKLSTADDTAYTDVKPSDAGRYTVRATVPETDTYYSITCIGSFSITEEEEGRSDPTATVYVPDTVIGTEYDPILTTDSDGKEKAVFDYKTKYGDDEYTDVKPTAAGEYIVRATIPETDNYNAIVCTGEFKINKKTVSVMTVTVSDVYVGQEFTPVLTTDSDGKSQAAFVYKEAGDSGIYTAEKPTVAGRYVVMATVPATETYEAASCTAEFTLLRWDAAASVSMDTVYVGTIYSPRLSTGSDGAADVSYMYKPKGAPDQAYTDIIPTIAGSYTVRATVPATGKYNSVSATADYEIIYLDAPKDPYRKNGKEGKKGYYVSEVYLNAPEGYSISTELFGTYGSSVLYSEGLENIYLKRNSDGACTAAVAVEQNIKIDIKLPVFTETAEGGKMLVDGSKMFADMLNVFISDDHLITVLVDGKPVDSVKSGMLVELDPHNWFKTFTVVAEDEAGNTESLTVTVYALWLIDRVIPEGKELPLEPNQSYNLGSGSWTVSGDNTVYSGDMEVYVNETRDYVFTKTE